MSPGPMDVQDRTLVDQETGQRSFVVWMSVLSGAAVIYYSAWIWAGSFVFNGVRYWTLHDDAMISMTYARTFSEGHGLVWYPGAEAVEGYTNLGWTLWMSFLHTIGLTETSAPLGVAITGALLLLVCGVLVAVIARRLGFGQVSAITAATLTMFCFPLVNWTMTGMEVGLLAVLALVSCLSADRLRADSGDRMALFTLCGAIGLGVVTRTDFMVIVVVVCAWLIWQRSSWLAPALVAAATLGVHTLFRVAYYGNPLPNTYYLKVTGLPLLDRVGGGLEAAGDSLLPLIVALGAAAAGTWVARKRPLWVLLAGVFVIQVAYSIWVGGDVWEHFGFANRYISVGLPGLLALASGAVAWLRQRSVSENLAGVAVFAVVAATAWGPVVVRWGADMGLGVSTHDVEQYGVALGEVVPPNTTVAVTWAGAIPYFSRTSGVDLLGKMDPVIAHLPIQPDSDHIAVGHNKWDYDYTIRELRPDVVPWLWDRSEGICAEMAQLGYIRGTNGAWVTSESGIDPNTLPPPPPDALTC